MLCKKCPAETGRIRKGMCSKCYYKDRRDINGESLNARAREFYEKNKERLAEKRALPENRLKEKEKHKKWYEKNKEARAKTIKDWRDKNREKVNEISKLWKINNPERWASIKEKMRSCPLKKLKTQIKDAYKAGCKHSKLKKNGKTFELLGFTCEDLINRMGEFLGKPCSCELETCTKEIISDENSHLDHIVPINMAETIEDVYLLNQLVNLRKILADCNLRRKKFLSQEEFTVAKSRILEETRKQSEKN